MPSVTLFYWVMCMTIDLSSEFSSKKIRIALYFSPYGVTGQYYILDQNNQAPKPPHFGMDTIGYKVALVKQNECCAKQGWLKKDTEIDLEKGRFIYAENERGEAYPLNGSVIKRSYCETVLNHDDKLVDRHGALIDSIDSKKEVYAQIGSPRMAIE